MSIAEWLNGGISRKQIYLKVALKYGYGKSFCDEMIQLHIDIQEEEVSNEQTTPRNKG